MLLTGYSTVTTTGASMVFYEVNAKLAGLFASEQYEAFAEYWQECVPTLCQHQKIVLIRMLTAEWRHDKLLALLKE